MKLIVTEQSVGFLAASYVKTKIKQSQKEGKNIVIAFPTGGTSIAMYENLRAFYKNGELSFNNVIAFNLDEYVGLPKEHAESYHYFMRKQLFDHIDIKPENINIPDGNAKDLKSFCAGYECKIKDCGGIDLFLGGVGINGHIAFNEPRTPFKSYTHVVDLTPSTIKANARFFDNDISKVPTQAVSMGLATILEAKEVVIMATGLTKARAIYEAIEGEKSEQWPITVLKDHKNAYLLTDQKAASEVSASAKAKYGTCSFNCL